MPYETPTQISHPHRLDFALLGRGAGSLSDDPTSWVHRVYLPPEGRRNLLREAWVNVRGIVALAEDTTKTERVFDVMGTFPVHDLVVAGNRRAKIVSDPQFLRLYEERSLPDLRTRTVRSFLESMPEGSLGRRYAEFVAARTLDNAFLGWMKVDDPIQYLGLRTAHLHDLFHFVLGYEAWDPVGEMEVEAFLYAQTGAVNHLFFLTGFVMNLLTNGRPEELARAEPRLREAYELGRRARNLMLVRWEDLLDRPLVDVKRELGIGHRPEARPELVPTATPKLAHLVLVVSDVEKALHFYTTVFGYHTVGRDEQLGAVFLTAGNDHHTLALVEGLPTNPIALVRKGPELLRRGAALLAGRLSSRRSDSGRRKVLPPPSVIRKALRPGIQHIGYRAASREDLETYVHLLRSHGVRIEWKVNHGDVIHGVYFFDGGGNLCEIFVDTEEAKKKVAEAEAAFARGERPVVDPNLMHSYDLDLDA